MTHKAPSLFDWNIVGPALLVTHAGKVLTHRQLLTEVWGPKAVGQTHYLRVHIAHLREKLEDESGGSDLIRTEPGIGYRFHPAE